DVRRTIPTTQHVCSLRCHASLALFFFFFFFNDTATTEIYTLSLHDALPISHSSVLAWRIPGTGGPGGLPSDRKSTRLNSSHTVISYAVFCLKKKEKLRDMSSILHTGRSFLSSTVVSLRT